jgi:ABC-type amino acid transport substrate-binding protein
LAPVVPSERAVRTALLLLLAASPARAADLAEVKAAGALRVIVAADESPDTFAVSPGADPGFERELLEAFSRQHGLRLEVVVVKGYTERIPTLLAGKGDVIAAIFDTPERRARVDFSDELMPTHNVAVTAAPRPAVATLEDLKRERVGVIRGTAPAQAVEDAGVPAASLRPFEKLDELIAALQGGGVGAAVLPISELALAAKRTKGLQAGLTVGAVGSIAWAVRKEDPRLRRALSEHIKGARSSGAWSRLILKYFGEQTLAVLGRAR